MPQRSFTMGKKAVEELSEDLKAAMDVEVAITRVGSHTGKPVTDAPERTPSQGSSFGGFFRRRSSMGKKEVEEMSKDLKASMDIEDAMKHLGSQEQTAHKQNSFAKPRPDNADFTRKLVPSNSLAAARARHMEMLAQKSEREAAQAAMRAEDEAKAEKAGGSQASSRAGGSRGGEPRGRPRREVAKTPDPLGPASSETPASKAPSSKPNCTPGPNGPADTVTGGDAKGEGEHDIQSILEGSYTEINELYGLTGERVMRYELVGVGRDTVAQLRSLFISLDDDGSGELGALELYEALVKFGQAVTDKQVKEMMDDVDKDGSGTIGFEEFLILAVPGASSGGPKVKREFSITKYESASFEDTVGRSEIADLQQTPLHIPIQCFSSYNPALEFLPAPPARQAQPAVEEASNSEGGEEARQRQSPENAASKTETESDDRANKTVLELRLRFKMPPDQRVSREASQGNIEQELKIQKGCWTPKKYLFGKKEFAPRDGKGTGIMFTVPEGSDGEQFPGPPKNKLLCVEFPGKKKEVTLYEGCPTLYGFPIFQITTKVLRINFEVPFGEAYKSMSHMAEFPPPIEHLTIISCGAGSSLGSLRRLVSSHSFLPPWYPFSFSTLCPDEEGKPRRIALKQDLGELENLPKGNVCLDVYLSKNELVESLIRHEAKQYSWVADMESIDYHTNTGVMTEISFRGGSVNLLEVAKPLRLGVRLTEQVEQKSCRLNRGWISCPPHPHVMPLLLSANGNIFVSPYVEGVSGDLITGILNASLLNDAQKRIVFIKVGLHVAWAVEYMHSHDIWHLDLKPSNLIITIDDSDPNKPRFWQQIHVRVCDYSRCSARMCSNLARRGTIGYWSPEQVHDRVDPLSERRSDLYWGLKKCKDPPPTSEADITERSDSWGWATMMLGLMGRLNEMRKVGYREFVNGLLDKGFTVNLSAIFLFEQQAFIDLVQDELDGVNKVYANVKTQWTKLSEDIERHRQDLEPVWQTAVKSLQILQDKDLNQLRGHRRPPPTVKLLNDAIASIMEIEKKEAADWPNFKQKIISPEFVALALKFDKDKGLSINAAKDLARCFRNPEFQIEAYVESNVPNSDPASPGSALAVATAIFQWVIALNEFNLLRRTLGPIQTEMKQKEAQMQKLDPKVAALEQKIATQKDALDVLKGRLTQNNRVVLDLMRSAEKDQALLKIKDILGMDNTLTNQQFKQLQSDCLYSTGDHSNVFRVLAWLNKLPPESDVRQGQPRGVLERIFARPPSIFATSVKTVMDDLYDKFACLRATRTRDPHDRELESFKNGGGGNNQTSFSRVGSGVSDFGRSASQFNRAPSGVSSFAGHSTIEEDDEESTWDHFPKTGAGVRYVYEQGGDSLPMQHKRHQILGFHSTGDGAGDGLSLVLAWCLQHQPVDRMPMSGVAAILMQLSPGQEWQHKGTVPGAAGLAKPHGDISEWAENNLVVAPKLAAAMIGDRNDACTGLALLERKALAAYEARNFMKASNCCMDLINKLEALDDEETYWMDLTKARVAMSRIRLRLGNMREAEDWQQSALNLIEARQSENPSDPSSCTFVCLRYHQSQAKTKKKETSRPQLSASRRQVLIQQKLLWAEVQIQRAAVMVFKVTHQGVNLNLEAFTILNRAATVIQEVLGPESCKLAAALRDMAEVQALRGRFRDALDIYKRALRIETRATGYDGYAAQPRIADMLHRMAEIKVVLGKSTEAIGLLQRAIHIYGAVDSQGLLHPKIPAVKECLGRAFQIGLRYSEASCAFQGGFDCCSRRLALHDRQGVNQLTQAEDLMQRGALALMLANNSVAYSDYMKASQIYQTEFKGMNWFGDKLEDNSELRVADCLLGAGAAQSAMGNNWKALELYQEAYQQILNRTEDEHNLALADVCERMATCYVIMDKKGIALDWLTRAVSIRELCQGKSHVDLAHTLVRISAVLRSAGQYHTAQDFTVRSLHMYVAVFERNHICVAESLENLAVCRFAPTAHEYNQQLRKLSTLKLQLDSFASRVTRCEARAELRREALTKLKKTPGIRKIALKDTEDKLEYARNEVANAKAAHARQIGMVKLREVKVATAKGNCEECLALVEEACAIVADIMPVQCQKLTNLKKGSKKMSELLHCLLSWAHVYASKAHTEASSPPDSPLTSMFGGGSVMGGNNGSQAASLGRAPSIGLRRPTTAKSSVSNLDAIQEAADYHEAELTAEQTDVGLGTNPAHEPSTPRSTKLPQF